MFPFHKFAVIAGSVLLGVSAILLLDRSQKEDRTARATKKDVEELAEKLKQAWAANHNP